MIDSMVQHALPDETDINYHNWKAAAKAYVVKFEEAAKRIAELESQYERARKRWIDELHRAERQTGKAEANKELLVELLEKHRHDRF